MLVRDELQDRRLKMSCAAQKCLLWAAFFVTSVAPVGDAAAQPPAIGGRGTRAEPTLASQISGRLKQLEADSKLDADLKKQLVDRYTTAQASLDDAAAADRKAAGFRDQLNRSAATLKQVQERLQKLPRQASANVDATVGSADLQRMITSVQTKINQPDTGLQSQARSTDEQATGRVKRLQEIPAQITDLAAALDMNQKELDASPPDNEPKELTEARRMSLQAQRTMLERQRSALQSELAWLEPAETNDLLRDQRDLAQRELALAQDEVKLLQGELDRRRQREAQEKVEAAQREAALAHPLLKPIADETQQLAEEDHALAERLRKVADDLQQAQSQFDSLQAESSRTREMVKEVGLTESIGLMLRSQRANIANPRELKERIRQRGDTIRDIRLKLFELNAKIDELSDVESALPKALAKQNADAPSLPGKTLIAEGETLLKHQREILTGLSNNYSKYIEQLTSLDTLERKLMSSAEEYGGFIDERAFWIRTSGWYGWSEARSAAGAAAEFLNAERWGELGDSIVRDFHREPVGWTVFGLFMAVWLMLRRRIRRTLHDVGDQAAEGSCRRFGPTLQAILLTLLLAAGPIGLLWFPGIRLESQVSGLAWTQAVGQGLLQAALVGTPFLVLQSICTRRGLAEQHLSWNVRNLRNINHQLRWFIPVGLALACLLGALNARADEPPVESLGRLVFMLLMVLLTLFCRAVLSGPHAVPSTDSNHPWAVRGWAWARTISLLVPTVLLVLVWAGYFYTAGQLAQRLQATAWLWFGLLTLRSIIMRWITLQRRRLALQQAQQLRAQAESELKQTQESSETGFSLARFDLGGIVGQILRLLNTSLVVVWLIGIWLIWAEVVPALGILNRVNLWQTAQQQTIVRDVEQVAGTSDTEQAQQTQETVIRLRWVTAADVLTAVVVLAIAIVAGRNIPGLLEISVLSRLPLDAGIRFAAILLGRYAIFIVGAVAAFGQIGVGWSNVQWLVAAASVGLGFGLQEIFANFVSGVILLMERPIRVGDVVTVGDVTGTVLQIRIRSTTIRDWDQKEFIVPNKQLITDSLLNWTLSNTVSRLVIEVGVSYSSDPRKVQELLLQIAIEQPSVMRDPAPQVAFMQFGDSSLKYVLYCFVPSLSNRLPTTDALNTQIIERFRAAGIEIPFPQRDLYVRSISGIGATPVPPTPDDAPPNAELRAPD